MKNTIKPIPGQRVRVFHLLTDENIGGAGKQLYYLMSKADYSTFEYTVILPEGSALTSLLGQTPARVIEFPGLCASYKPETVRKLIALFRKEKPDIVHTHASVSARVAAKKAFVPVTVMTKHCSDLPKRFFRVFPGKTACRLHFALTLSAAIATDDSSAYALRSCGVSKKKIHTVYNGALPLTKSTESECLSLRKKLGVPENAYILGYFGRLEPEKGVENLLRTASLCLRQTENLYFMIVGTGSLEAELYELAVRYGIRDRIIFTGFKENISPYMSLCSLNLNCSLGVETSNLSSIEGMSIGVMPVMTDIGGSSRLCRDVGVIVPPDDPPAMADAIMSLLRDPGQIECMSERCKNAYKAMHTAGRMAKQTEDIYRLFIN